MNESRQSFDPFRTKIDPLIEFADRALYVLVAAFFLIAAVVLGVDAIAEFFTHLDDVRTDVVTFVNALLLVLIILEVLGTVRDYLKTGTTSLKPFLYIGIISATRRILAIGAESAFQSEKISETVFRHLMIDLAVNGGVVLALALAVYLFGRGERVMSSTSGTTETSTEG